MYCSLIDAQKYAEKKAGATLGGAKPPGCGQPGGCLRTPAGQANSVRQPGAGSGAVFAGKQHRVYQQFATAEYPPVLVRPDVSQSATNCAAVDRRDQKELRSPCANVLVCQRNERCR